mgnify:CR=1 FL=1
MKIAFLFPGQGAQTVGMGKDFYEEYEVAKKIYKQAERETGIEVSKLSFEGPEEELNQTKNTQICMVTMSLAILELLKEARIKAEYSAGLSLGEYVALNYAGAINLKDTLKIIQKRGEYMQNLAPEGDWAMAAVLGLSDETVEEVCKKVKTGFAVPANYNCPGQVAVSGDRAGIQELTELAKSAGAKRVIELKTSGPFHTEKLQKASEALRKELDNIQIGKLESIVVKNLDAKPYTEKDDIKEILAKHVMSPVRFSASIKYMLDNGVDTFVEIGPGKVLTSLVKKVNREVKCINISNVDSLKEAIKELNIN